MPALRLIAGEVASLESSVISSLVPTHQPDRVQRPEPREDLVLRSARPCAIGGVHACRGLPLAEQQVVAVPLFVFQVGHRRRRGRAAGNSRATAGSLEGSSEVSSVSELVRRTSHGVALLRIDSRTSKPVAGPCGHRAAHRQRSFCIVAHSPYACSRATSRSASSREPFDTTALPLVCTSIISFSAFGPG